MTRRVGVSAAVVAVLVLSVVVGRWEGAKAVRAERLGMARVYAAAAAHPVPDAWRLSPPLRCLDYRKGTNNFAYEVCFDSDGRLLEAADRTARVPKFWLLTAEPSKASITVSVHALDVVLNEMDANDPHAPLGPAIRPVAWFNAKLKPPKIPLHSGLPGYPR